MSDPLIEIAEFTGKACGIIAKDLADVSKPLAAAFRRGWREAMAERPAGEPAPAPHSTPESA
jgi:hypothetical protein